MFSCLQNACSYNFTKTALAIKFAKILSLENYQLYAIPYNGLFFLGANFPEQLVLAKIFLIQKFTSPATEKSYVNVILHKDYMNKTVICRVRMMSTVIKRSLPFVHGHHVYRSICVQRMQVQSLIHLSSLFGHWCREFHIT